MRNSFESGMLNGGGERGGRSFSQPYIGNPYQQQQQQQNENDENYLRQLKRMNDYTSDLDRQIMEKREVQERLAREEQANRRMEDDGSFSMYENALKQNPHQFRAGLADLKGVKPNDEQIRKEEEKRKQYKEMLDQQLIEKQKRKEMERMRIQEIKRKEEESMDTYNPWGKPGAGAPLRDSRGAPIANLKTFQPVDFNEKKNGGVSMYGNNNNNNNNGGGEEFSNQQQPNSSRSNGSNQEGGNFTRFKPDPNSDFQKEEIRKRHDEAMRLQLVLAQQIEEKNRLKQLEKEKEKREEEEAEARFLRQQKEEEERLKREEEEKKQKKAAKEATPTKAQAQTNVFEPAPPAQNRRARKFEVQREETRYSPPSSPPASHQFTPAPATTVVSSSSAAAAAAAAAAAKQSRMEAQLLKTEIENNNQELAKLRSELKRDQEHLRSLITEQASQANFKSKVSDLERKIQDQEEIIRRDNQVLKSNQLLKSQLESLQAQLSELQKQQMEAMKTNAEKEKELEILRARITRQAEKISVMSEFHKLKGQVLKKGGGVANGSIETQQGEILMLQRRNNNNNNKKQPERKIQQQQEEDEDDDEEERSDVDSMFERNERRLKLLEQVRADVDNIDETDFWSKIIEKGASKDSKKKSSSMLVAETNWISTDEQLID